MMKEWRLLKKKTGFRNYTAYIEQHIDFIFRCKMWKQ